ncbi:MAG TPA: hypothetical protein VMD91_15230 [Candidatus Sulfotelmatobacter sp.]|nr:hypothetical protein [Candidatus Sulfotelmatobacter sp.]
MSSAQVPGFLPSQSGLHFPNSWNKGTNYPVVTLPVIGTVASQDANKGLCGGFVMTALDMFLHAPRLLPPNDTTNPPDPSPLFNYLSSRLLDSLDANGPKDVQWTQVQDHDVTIELEGAGLSKRMIETEWPAIKADIDAGRPSPLSLVAKPWCGPGDVKGIIAALSESHQVLAWAYDLDAQNNLTLKVYDPNDPFNNDAEIRMNVGGPTTETIAISCPSISQHLNGAQIRGVFRSAYGLKDPSALAQPHIPFMTWAGNFGGQDSLLLYNPPSNNWWLGTFSAGTLTWTNVDNTAGFGNVSGDQFWVGNFITAGSSDILFYNAYDNNWWIGSFSGSGSNAKLSWSLAANTAGFGNISSPPPAHRFWVGAFDGSGKDNILFFNQYDANWWLGQFDATGKITWKLATNSKGFGGGEASGLFFVGHFSSQTADSVLFYHPGDGNWFLGSFNGTTMTFAQVGNTVGFGDISAPPPVHRFWVGNFVGGEFDQVLFFNQPDENWWVGAFVGGQMKWGVANNSATQFGGGEATGVFFQGKFNGSEAILFYHPDDANWFLGTFSAYNISWMLVDNSSGFGYIANDLFFTGTFGTPNTTVVFFHEDGHWWQGTVARQSTTWKLVAATAGKAW